jgi:hypothetical protein
VLERWTVMRVEEESFGMALDEGSEVGGRKSIQDHE